MGRPDRRARLARLAVVDGVVVAWFGDDIRSSMLVGLDARTGEQLWTRSLEAGAWVDLRVDRLLLQHRATSRRSTDVEVVDVRSGLASMMITGDEVRVTPTAVLRRRGDRVDALDPATREVLDTMTLPAGGLPILLRSITHTGAGFVVSTPDRTTLVVDGRVRSALEHPGEGQHHLIDVTEPSARLLLSVTGDNVSMLSVVDGELSRQWTRAGWPVGGAPDGDVAVVLEPVTGEGRIELVDAVGGEVVWAHDGGTGSSADVGSDGLVAVVEHPDGTPGEAVAAFGLDGRRLWHVAIKDHEAFHLLDRALVTTRTDVATGTTTLTLRS